MIPKEWNIPRCKKFTGYKPCLSYVNCLEKGCQNDLPGNRIGTKILIISLDALGNVLDNTPILRTLKRSYTESTIYWLTMPAAVNILRHNNLIDRIFSWTDEERMILRNMSFDLVLSADKSDYACAFANELTTRELRGFKLNEDGIIVPANLAASYSYLLGNDDELKFRKNTRSGIDILHEALELPYGHDECIYSFTEEEQGFIADYKTQIRYDREKIYVGFNTGCSNLFPNKKMTVEQHAHVIDAIIDNPQFVVVLLGGREDTERNVQIINLIAAGKRDNIVSTPTTEGIRRGACYMAITDIVITGDSFGMHLGIALKKFIIAWFGMSCASEIELYGRGVKLIPEGLECSPCWKKVCPYNLECIEQIDLERIVKTVQVFKKGS